VRLDRQLAGPTPADWPEPLDWPPAVDGLKPELVRVVLALQRVYWTLFPAPAALAAGAAATDDSTDTETDLPDDASAGDVATAVPSLFERAEPAVAAAPAASAALAAPAAAASATGQHKLGSEPSLDDADLGAASVDPAAEVKLKASASTSRQFGGLRNARQGCYANAVMQQLAVAKGFREFIAQIE
jgi:hypothetical protein